MEVLRSNGAYTRGTIDASDYASGTFTVRMDDGRVKYLVEEAKVPVNPTDRWGNAPLDDALRSRHAGAVHCAKLLRDNGAKVRGGSPASAARRRWY